MGLFVSKSKSKSKLLKILFVVAGMLLTISCEQEQIPTPSNQIIAGPPKPCPCIAEPHNPNKWDKCEIYYFIENSSYTTDLRLQIIAAFKKWEQHLKENEIYISFTNTGDASNADIVLLYRKFINDPFVCNEPRLAVSCFTDDKSKDTCPDQCSGNINSPALIVMNSGISWGSMDPKTQKVYDFFPTMLHEIGHRLGLKHINEESALMYCFSTGQTDFSSHDTDAIKQVLEDVKCEKCITDAPVVDKFTDPRDGQVYSMVRLGDMWWMSENLSFDSGDGSLCYTDTLGNVDCTKYGRYYTWRNAMAGSYEEGAQGICPPGWHIPTKQEYLLLERSLLASPKINLVDLPELLVVDGCSEFNAEKSGFWIPRTPTLPVYVNSFSYAYEDSDRFKRQSAALFWTSSNSDNDPPKTQGQSYAYRISPNLTSLQFAYFQDRYALNIRCVKCKD